MEWASSNLALNLDFVPDDKLEWQPAPTAPSALGIVRHLLGVLWRMTPLLGDGTPFPGEPQNVTDRPTAQNLLIEAAQKYAAAMRAIPVEDLDNTIETRMGNLPLRVLAAMPVMDMVHHHGQIAYIQMLLGDTETHRDMSLLLQ